MLLKMSVIVETVETVETFALHSIRRDIKDTRRQMRLK